MFVRAGVSGGGCGLMWAARARRSAVFVLMGVAAVVPYMHVRLIIIQAAVALSACHGLMWAAVLCTCRIFAAALVLMKMGIHVIHNSNQKGIA